MSTRKPFWISQKQTLERFVLLPTPFTPTKTILQGNFRWNPVVGMDNKRSVELLAVIMRVMEFASAWRTSEVVAERERGKREMPAYFGNL